MSPVIGGIGKIDKDSAAMVREAMKQGFTVVRLGNDHLRIKGPGGVVTLSSTPSDWRHKDNMISNLKRIGLRWPPVREERVSRPGDEDLTIEQKLLMVLASENDPVSINYLTQKTSA